jgi:AraC family transcriptional regulator
LHQRIHTPEALDRRHAIWNGARFDAGARPSTSFVRGRTAIAQHLVLVTLRGGARRLSVTSDCGHRHVGRDVAGAVSFVPAGCVRSIELEDVEAAWASVALDDAALWPDDERCPLRPFTNTRDPFVASLVAALDQAHRRDGGLDALYAEAMALALGRHLVDGLARSAAPAVGAGPLPSWKLCRVEEFVAANLRRPIAIAELAAVAGLSVGRFHRAFKAATGQTPLRFLQEAKVRKAAELLQRDRTGVLEASAAVGFASPSHFARVYRAIAGVPPSGAR